MNQCYDCDNYANNNNIRCSNCQILYSQQSKKAHKEHKKEIGEFSKQTDKFAKENDIQIKCISDKILLYIRYGLYKIIKDRIGLTYSESYVQEEISRMENSCIDLYRLVRGKVEYTNKNPRIIAAGIVYIISVMEGFMLTQVNIADVFLTTEVSIRKIYTFIKKTEKL